MKIVIVDDSKAMRMIVMRTLRQAGYGDHTLFLIGKPFTADVFAEQLGAVLV